MDFEIVHTLPPVLSNSDWCAIDLELFGAEKHKLHRPTTGTFACLSLCYVGDIIHVILNEEEVAETLQRVNNAVWIFHNSMFDITHLRRWAEIKPRKKLWDTMIVEREMCGGLYDSYSLEDVVRRRLDYQMDKTIRKTFENQEPVIVENLEYDNATDRLKWAKKYVLTPEQIQYCAEDAWLDRKVCEHQKTEITKKDYRIWTDVDRKAFWPMLDFSGFRINVDGWLELAKRNKEHAEGIKAGLDFNPASPQQVKAVLISKGFKGLKSTEEKTLQQMIEKHPDKKAVPIAQQILEYRKYAKRASTYGQNFIDKHLEHENDYDVIRAGYWVVGTEHGRTASSDPNYQNIPVRETKEFREQHIARPNHKLIIADMGQQETRIGAYFSQDKALINILQDRKQDVFVGMARIVYKRDITKDDPFRKQVKNTAYGIFYGMSPEGMAERYGMSVEDAERAINDVFNAFPELYGWITRQKKKRDYVETVMGRRIWLNPHSDQVERNAVNSPISGTAADQMKIALGNNYEKWNFPVPYTCVGYIHDELIFDQLEKYAHDIGDFISKEMVSAAEMMCVGVPFIADYKICDTWAEKE